MSLWYNSDISDTFETWTRTDPRFLYSEILKLGQIACIRVANTKVGIDLRCQYSKYSPCHLYEKEL